ncbi:hypothetical protein BHE74_00053326 [Ensete ventricosum]|nr:hypothetical protein BHE74_00053326 [Ensete ventricosum]
MRSRHNKSSQGERLSSQRSPAEEEVAAAEDVSDSHDRGWGSGVGDKAKPAGSVGEEQTGNVPSSRAAHFRIRMADTACEPIGEEGGWMGRWGWGGLGATHQTGG